MSRRNMRQSNSDRGIQERRDSVTISVSSFPKPKDISQIELVDHTGSTKVIRQNADSGAVEDAIVCENLLTDFNDIKEAFVMLTDEQRKIVMHIYSLYNLSKSNVEREKINGVGNNSPKIILQGPAGTGKTTVINFIEKLVTWEENKACDDPQKLKVLKCAYTGRAAADIKGFTMNNMLSIPFYNTRSLRKEKLDTKKSLLEDCIFFICDEISMVGERLMDSVNMRLKQIFNSEELYGGRFVLLVGDLYQIDPVNQKSLYPNSKLWTCCDFYELTKIIRQPDKRFTNALNNFRDSKMTKEDVKSLKSREIQDTSEVPDTVIHLFYLNKHVNEYNNEKICKSIGQEEIVNNIIDDNLVPTTLRVKIGIRYMITYNMDVGDGLANGTTGVVKGFDYDQDKKVNVVWMEFYDDMIGRKARSNYYNKNRGPKPGFEKLVPICQSKILVKLRSDPTGRRRVPNMFPLIAAEAITVHKSQGQTFHEGVCIHFTDDPYDKLRTDKSLQYVALTRVTKIEDLYISGKLNISLVNTDKMNRVEKELKRLRTERNLKLAYETFDNKTEDVIICLNTGLTFKDHYQFIASDKWYDNGSLLIFTETNTIKSDIIEIPNFEIAFRSDYDSATALRSGGTVICYKKANKSVEVISSITDNENKIHLNLFLYEKYLYIITAINGNLNNYKFKLAIQGLLLHYVEDKKCLFFIANCNMSSNISDIFNTLNFEKKITCEVIGTNEEKLCDVLLMKNYDVQQEDMGLYEYIPSPHKPIYVKLYQRNREACSSNYQKPCSTQHVHKTSKAIVCSATQDTNDGCNTARGMVANVIPVTHATEFDVGLNKRPRESVGDSTSLSSSPKRTRVRPQTEVLAAENMVNMVIVPVHYPAVKIQMEHLSAIQSAILRLVDNAPDPPPRIMLGNIVRGVFHISCQGNYASTWITSVIGQEEIAGILLKAVDPKDLPKPVKMIWESKVVGNQDIKLMLRVLQRFNPFLHTDLWEMINTSTSDTKTEHTILVDPESAKVIKASGYQLFDGIGSSSFKLLENVDGACGWHLGEDVDGINVPMTNGATVE